VVLLEVEQAACTKGKMTNAAGLGGLGGWGGVRAYSDCRRAARAQTTQIAIGEQRLTTIRDQGQRTTQIAIGEQRLTTQITIGEQTLTTIRDHK
jgi:hypothetical protein